MEGREKNDCLYVVIPAYNEQDNLAQVISDWYSVVENIGGNSRLVVIDDGSKDHTYKIMLEMAQTRPMLEALTKPNGGHGATVLYGYRYAIKHGADYVFQTDSDGQTNPAEFDNFWNLRTEYDVVIGCRSMRGDGKLRTFVEQVVCLILHIYFGVKVPDANAPFRLMKTEMLEKYIDRLPNDYNLPNIMMTTYFAYYGEKMIFKEISFQPRQGGRNSIDIKKIALIGWRALGDFHRQRKDM